MTYDPVNDVFWADDWNGNLYTYDPKNGYARTAVTTLGAEHDGIAYIVAP